MSSDELPHRQYEGWWFVSDRPVTIDATTGKPVMGTTTTSPPGETLREMWQPLSASDNDRLEAAYQDSSHCDLPDCVVIHDSTGQRLSRVALHDMLVTPLYWEGLPRPARRSIWMQMAASEDVRGGWPVPAEWDAVLEKAYQEHREWLASSRGAITSPASPSPSSDGGTTSSVIEKLVGLDDPLAGYALVLRKGSLDTAKLTKKSRLDTKPGLFNGKDDSIRLIRGYTSYYIAVTSAIKALTAAGKSTDIPPMVLANPFETCLLETPKAPTNLIFAVHGIGQKLAGRLGTNFINDCDTLRAQVKSAIAQRAGDIEDLLVLPVNWRSTMYMGIKSYFPQSDADELSFENLVSMITLPNIPFIRDVASDVGLDILLYMTPAYFHRIIRATLNEIRRIYKIFVAVGGEGAERTRISLVGHSLGAAIVSDLLSFIVSDTELNDRDAVNRAAEAVIANLGFPVDRFFALGSPLAMFFLLKQLKPLGCVAHIYEIPQEGSSEPRGIYPSLPDPQDSRELHPRKMMFACRQIYNIFHPYDPSMERVFGNDPITNLSHWYSCLSNGTVDCAT